MLTQTIPAYLYQQYADDDNLQSLVDAYNQMVQAYVTWFATVGLPFYPGLSGSLLYWVIVGLYGYPKPAIATSSNPAVGPLNTQLLNISPLNTFTAPASGTSYSLSDDLYQRSLTWCFFKGDGKQYCIPWLKRRVMRFLAGPNGLDPNPYLPNFIVGPENTSAVSVTSSGGTVTVTISQSQLATLIAVPEQTLQVFALLLEGGFLDVPAQYSYSVTIAS